ncbi:MAG: hypothetical protein WC301_07865 [Candidatus Omnitrophota bacterium]
MVKINYPELEFNHAVTFNTENTVFATARENDSGKTRIFLIFTGDRVYTRNGVASSWELLGGADTRRILENIYGAIVKGLPTYKINGSSHAVAGHGIQVN